MPRNVMDTETMELYKRMPANAYENAEYHYGEFCSNCGQNEYEDALRNIAIRRRRMKSYEKHCPSCHCPPDERRRFSPPDRPWTSGDVKAVVNRYERVLTEPISSAIKKSQSSPLSQKVCWHDCQTGTRHHCPRRSLQARRQRRVERDNYSFKMRGDTVDSGLANEDVEAWSKRLQSTPIKSSLKKHNHCREPEESEPDEQNYTDVESDTSMKRVVGARQSKKSRDSNRGTRRHRVVGDGEYVAEMSHENDVEHRQGVRECRETRGLVSTLESFEGPKHGEATVAISEDDKGIGTKKDEVARATKQKKDSDVATYCVTSKPSELIKGSIDRPAKEPAHLTKLDLHATKNCILESIDHMLGAMDDTKNDAPIQQEQTEQETIDNLTRELQENGWQLLFNALTIHRDSTNCNRRHVRLECLNHIRQQLDKLYALESSMDNCPFKLRSLSGHDMPCNEERQQLEQQSTSQQQLEQMIDALSD